MINKLITVILRRAEVTDRVTSFQLLPHLLMHIYMHVLHLLLVAGAN